MIYFLIYYILSTALTVEALLKEVEVKTSHFITVFLFGWLIVPIALIMYIIDLIKHKVGKG